MNLFPYGRAALSLLLVTIIAGVWIALRPVQRTHPTLTYWTFDKNQYAAYQQVIPEFERKHPGVIVEVQLVSYYALAPRLQAAFLSDSDVPDLCELEIDTAGTLFRGPVKDIGFLNLKPYLQSSGLYDRMVQARFAPYTSRGEIFGMPHDVHAEQIAYRRDIFAKYGINPDKLKTWADFEAVGRKMTIPGQQYMIELDDSDATMVESFMFQEGGNYFDSSGRCTLDAEPVVKALELYVPMVAGPNKIGTSVGDSFGAQFAKAVEDGYECSIICPDWRSKQLEQLLPPLKGQMGLMPFPAIEPGGIRTSTWGGTMCGITKRCKHPGLAWEFLKFLYTDPSQAGALFERTHIVPPIKDEWNLPVIQQPNAFFGGQKLGATYAALAPYVPARYTSPEIDTANTELGLALTECVGYYNQHGNDAGFDPFVRMTLRQCAGRVRQLAARNPF